jgi:hypothetical protein
MARTIAQKIETSRANARIALDAYRATGDQDPDDLTLLGDLIADLMHLADEFGATEPFGDGLDFTDPTREWAGSYVQRLAAEHYDHERNPDHADEEV